MPPGLSTLRQLRCRLTLIFGEDDQCTGIIGMNSTMPLEINMDERSEMDASSSSTQHGEQVLQEAMGGGTYNVQADGAERLVMGKRAGTLPDGQPLPAWQSWSAVCTSRYDGAWTDLSVQYETQVNGDWVYTGTVVEVDAETCELSLLSMNALSPRRTKLKRCLCRLWSMDSSRQRMDLRWFLLTHSWGGSERSIRDAVHRRPCISTKLEYMGGCGSFSYSCTGSAAVEHMGQRGSGIARLEHLAGGSSFSRLE